MWLKDISHCKSVSKITNWTKKKISRIVLTLYKKKKKTSFGYIRRRCVNAEREWMKNCSAPLNHRLHFPAMQRKQNGNAALIVEGLHRRTHSIQSFRRHCQVQLAAGKSTCLSFEFPRADLSSISRSGCFCQTSLHSCHVIGAIHIVQWQQLFSCLPWVTLSKVQKKTIWTYCLNASYLKIRIVPRYWISIHVLSMLVKLVLSVSTHYWRSWFSVILSTAILQKATCNHWIAIIAVTAWLKKRTILLHLLKMKNEASKHWCLCSKL